jgi:hypothetical protein
VFDHRRVAGGRVAEGKAIWVVRNGQVSIENIRFEGAKAPDGNGAGLRFEKGSLAVRRCVFVDNENGILVSNDPDAVLVVEDSQFSDSPRGHGTLNHLLYVGAIRRAEITGSRFHNAYRGHLVKSRAQETVVAYNLLQDGPQGNASYQIDLPNGGDATVIGNVIAKGPHRDNPVAVSYGAEGKRWPRNRLVLAHNTFVNEGWAPAWFLRVHADRLGGAPEVHALNNLLVGAGLLGLNNPGRFDDNWPATAAMLNAPELLDYALPPDSLLRGRVDDPARAGDAFAPRREFRMPVGTVPLLPPARWAPGAFQR